MCDLVMIIWMVIATGHKGHGKCIPVAEAKSNIQYLIAEDEGKIKYWLSACNKTGV